MPVRHLNKFKFIVKVEKNSFPSLWKVEKWTRFLLTKSIVLDKIGYTFCVTAVSSSSRVLWARMLYYLKKTWSCFMSAQLLAKDLLHRKHSCSNNAKSFVHQRLYLFHLFTLFCQLFWHAQMWEWLLRKRIKVRFTENVHQLRGTWVKTCMKRSVRMIVNKSALFW